MANDKDKRKDKDKKRKVEKEGAGDRKRRKAEKLVNLPSLCLGEGWLAAAQQSLSNPDTHRLRRQRS